MRTLVLGMGNPVLTDDGVGWHVVRRVQSQTSAGPELEFGFSCRGGLALMERMIGYDRVVLVDAIRSGRPPGTVVRLNPSSISTQHSASAHDVNLPTALEVGRRLGAHLPSDRQITLVAVEAADVETFGESCTKSVERAIPAAVSVVGNALRPEGVRHEYGLA